MTDRETFQARAAEARASADEALLDNVRDRCLRSEAAWSEMAARAERTEKMRAARDAEKAVAMQVPPEPQPTLNQADQNPNPA